MLASFSHTSFSITIQQSNAPSRFYLRNLYSSVVNSGSNSTIRVQPRHARLKVPHSVSHLLVLLRVRDADYLLIVQRA